MDKNQISEKVKNLILKGRLEDAATELISFFDKNVIDKDNKDIFRLYNQAIHQVSQLNEVKNAQLSGIIEDEDAILRRNKVRKALLEIINKIKGLGAEKNTDYSEIGDVTQKKSRNNNSKLILIGILLLLLGISIGYAALKYFSNEESTQPKTEETNDSKEVEAKRQSDADRKAKKDEVNRQAEADRIAKLEKAKRKADADSLAKVKKERLQADADRKARITQIILQPDINGMGTGKGVSGGLISGPYSPFSPPSFGDNKKGNGTRGFLTFHLIDIPSDAKIISANLICAKGGHAGNPYVFNEILIEKVDIGTYLDYKDFNISGTLLKKIRLKELERKVPIDIKQAIKLAIRNRYKVFTLRFRPSWGNNNDDSRDTWAFSYSRGDTKIEIEFE